MINDSAPTDLGNWDPEMLSKTLQSFSGKGTDSGLEEKIRFLTNVAKLIRLRVAQPDASSDPKSPATFVLAPEPPSETGTDLKRVPMLDNGLTPVNGRIWFVPAVVYAGQYMAFSSEDDDELFNVVINDLASGTKPAVIYDPRVTNPPLRFYPAGLQNPNDYWPYNIHNIEVTQDALFAAIDSVYRQMLITPGAQSLAGRLWKDPARYIPVYNAEAVIQSHLRAGLTCGFPMCDIREEQGMPEGRTDLEIEEKDPLIPSKLTRHALVELKVLRSFRSSGAPVAPTETLKWISSGVEQAHAYRVGKGSLLTTLCCFDMRDSNDDDNCLKHELARTASLQVIMRRWYLYSSTQRYQSALAGG